MEVCKARPRPLPAIHRRRFRSSLFGVRRFLAPYIWHRTSLQNVIKINHQVAIYNCLLKSPVTSVKKDASRGELCKVLWTIEADLADGQLLYISGDPFTLGRWEPEMAVLLSPSTEHPNLWKTEVKVPCGTNFKYNYFIRKDKWPSCDLIWRSGPEFSISIPLFSEQNKKIVVRDSWLTDQSERLPVYSWGSWIEETILAANPVTAVLSGDDQENLTSCESGYLDLKSSSIDLTVKDESHSSRKDDTSTYSKTLIDMSRSPGYSSRKDDTSTYSKTLIDMSRSPGYSSRKRQSYSIVSFSETFSERDQPVEEPWLLQSSTYFLDPDKESIESMLERVVCPDKSFQGTENPEGRSKLTCFRELVSTVMLINSSKCTMQRIAVLEDGKLVELLLEPVKGNVQCGSVYLGEITQLVPRMRGALVNIGSPRSSLMEIRNHREPFVFPPFNHMAKEKESNGSVIGKQTEHSDTHDNEPSSDGDIEVCNGSAGFDFQDDPVLFSHEDFEENEIGDDFNVSGVLQGNLNGSAVDYEGEGADFDDYCDGNGHQLEGESETVNGFLPVEMEDSHVSQPPHTLKRLVDASRNDNKWAHVRRGTKIIVQVIKEGLGSKGPAVTAYPTLKSRFWILMSSWDEIGVSSKVMGTERTRLRIIAKTLQPPGFGLKVRSVAAGHSLEELQKDLKGLLSTWKDIMEKAKSKALAADEGVDGAVPVILHKAMGQTLSVAQDCFNEDLRMVVDSPRTYHEVTNYLKEIAPDLCDRVELYDKKNPIFDEYGIEEEINHMLNKRVPIANGGSLVIEQTEALVSIDVNGGHGMLGQGTSQEKAVLDVNLAAAKQIARELRLRDIGGIIVVDFIDMANDLHKRLIYEEMKKAVERDRSAVKVSELSRHGLMEITRKRVRPSVTFMISEPCTCCHATGRVEALETTFSKIEHEICRLLAKLDQKTDFDNPESWPRFILKVEHFMCTYLTVGKKTRLTLLSSSLKVRLLLKVTRDFTRGVFEVIPFTDSEKNDQQHQVALSRLRQTKAVNNIPSRKLRWKTGGR